MHLSTDLDIQLINPAGDLFNEGKTLVDNEDL